MNPTNALIFTGIVVTAGRWAEGKRVDMRVVLGIAVTALFLSAIDSADPGLANQFGLLILVAAVWRYGIPLARKTGFAQ